MAKVIIKGPSKLKGTVKVQGAKNAAMKHVLLPLLSNDISKLENIPNIGSTNKLLEIPKLFGAIIKRKNRNSFVIDTSNLKSSVIIPKEIFYYTSGAIHAIPIIASIFGSCKVEIDPDRFDTGGDQLGSRKFEYVIQNLQDGGFDYVRKGNVVEFIKVSNKPFIYEVPVRSFSASVNTLICALFKSGKSTIKNVTGEAEFEDIVRFLQKAGADIKKVNQDLIIKGPVKLKGINFRCMYDRNDFATFISAALTTDSEITIRNVNYKRMKLESMQPVLDKMNIRLEFKKNSCVIKSQLTNIKPANILAGMYPRFQTEWQVLFSPLFTQIKGQSEITECIFTDRMRHWDELKKFGAIYEYFKTPKFPEKDRCPRAVKVVGPAKLKGAQVQARDVRSGAALLIAGLAAHGTTEVSGVEHIERGYEDIIKRFQSLGADIKCIK